MFETGQEKIMGLFQKNKPAFFCLLAFPLLLSIIPVMGFCQREFVVFPAADIGNRISVLNDAEMNGKSVIRKFSYDQRALTLEYVLREGAESPMVFFTISLGSSEKPFDLSTFNAISLRIKKATNKRIMLFIKTYLPGISSSEPKDAITLRHNQYILQLIPGCRQYTIGLKDFTTQPWWIDRMKVNRALLPQESFRKTITFDMQFNREGSDFQTNQPEKIIIERIAFQRAVNPAYGIILGAVILFYMGLGFIWAKRTLKTGDPKILARKPLEISSHREKELGQIKEFIETNYCSADISTRMVSEVLGITSTRVFELLKEEYHLTFKQLINKMRIEEAKRLLRETDLRITEIALNLGFNSVSYFNNLFKTDQGMTPSDYREKTKNERESVKF